MYKYGPIGTSVDGDRHINESEGAAKAVRSDDGLAGTNSLGCPPFAVGAPVERQEKEDCQLCLVDSGTDLSFSAGFGLFSQEGGFGFTELPSNH